MQQPQTIGTELAQSAVGQAVVGLTALVALMGGIFGLAVAIKMLFFTKKDPNSEFVTRAELDHTVQNLEAKISDIKSDLKQMDSHMESRLSEFKNDMTTRLEKLDVYAHQTNHEQTNILQIMGLKVERLLSFREAELTLLSKSKPEKGHGT